MRTPLLYCLVAAVAAITAPSARAQADLTFSGGSGTPLSVTLNEPVTFTITADAADGSPDFNFQDVGNVFQHNFQDVTGDITFEIDGGTPLMLDFANTGVTGGDITPTTLYFFGDLPGVAAGDVVTLNAGTETTTGNVPTAAPNDGPYSAFISDGIDGSRISLDGVTVPEPSTWALLGFGAAAAGVVGLRRRRARA